MTRPSVPARNDAAQPSLFTPRAQTDLPALQRELSSLAPKQRLDRVLSCPDTMRVVRALPVQDLYATMRSVGVEDCLEILELCSPAQVQGFLDLDGWRRDRVDAVSIAGWLRALFTANPDRAVGQLRGLDIELLTLLFKIHARVYDLTLDEQPDDEVGRHAITPDNRYLIVYGGVGADDAMQATLAEAIERMMARDISFVLRLCEAIRWELPSPLEEEAYRWRNSRLADLGFLPTHEAAEVFAWLDPDGRLPGVSSHIHPPAAEDGVPGANLSTSVLLPWDALSDGQGALGRAISDLPERERARVAHELMLVANRVHAADGADLGDADALRATAHGVADTVGIALAYRSKGDATKLAGPLSSTSVQVLFRVGHSLSLRLQRELKHRIAAEGSGLSGEGLLRLDAPLREVCAGLLRPRPLVFGGLLDARRVDYRPPASLVDVAAVAAALGETAFRAALLVRLGATDDVVRAIVGEGEQPTHGMILGAALSRSLVDRAAAWHIAPMSGDELTALRARLAKGLDDAARDALLADLDARVRTLAPLPGAPTADEAVARARTYARQVLQAIVDELPRVAERRPDGRFLTSVWA